jgi:hypothetical protein
MCVRAAAPAAPPKPAVPIESAADVERRMMESIAEEKRQKALAGMEMNRQLGPNECLSVLLCYKT